MKSITREGLWKEFAGLFRFPQWAYGKDGEFLWENEAAAEMKLPQKRKILKEAKEWAKKKQPFLFSANEGLCFGETEAFSQAVFITLIPSWEDLVRPLAKLLSHQTAACCSQNVLFSKTALKQGKETGENSALILRKMMEENLLCGQNARLYLRMEKQKEKGELQKSVCSLSEFFCHLEKSFSSVFPESRNLMWGEGALLTDPEEMRYAILHLIQFLYFLDQEAAFQIQTKDLGQRVAIEILFSCGKRKSFLEEMFSPFLSGEFFAKPFQAVPLLIAIASVFRLQGSLEFFQEEDQMTAILYLPSARQIPVGFLEAEEREIFKRAVEQIREIFFLEEKK